MGMLNRNRNEYEVDATSFLAVLRAQVRWSGLLGREIQAYVWSNLGCFPRWVGPCAGGGSVENTKTRTILALGTVRNFGRQSAADEARADTACQDSGCKWTC